MSERASTFIRTKLSPPRVGGSPVPRLKLLSTLEERRDSRLTIILGPAGCGKSTLGALWRRQLVQTGADVAWYNFSSDDDEAQFVGYLASSFEAIGLPIGADALEIYNQYGGKSMNELLAALVNDLDDYAKPLYLVLEDFHYCQSQAIVDFLDRLLELAPSNFHLIVSSRTRPAFNLSSLRMKGLLTEIGFLDLRFTYEEAARFLRSRGIVNLSSTQLRVLHDMTDGWAAGLQLAAFSLRKSTDPERAMERLTTSLALGRENSFNTYLRESVAAHLEADELDFLAKTSACRRFNRELCELITGNAKAGELLARFEADNLFVIPIESDDVTPWYRFHRVFALFLNEQLLKLQDTELKKLNQLASHWFGGKGLYIEAIRHALYAGDEAFCIDLVDRAARSTINSANFFLLLGWFRQLPREKLADRLNLLLCVGWAQLSCGRLHDFEWTFQAISAHPSAAKPGTQFEVQLLQAYKLIQQDDSDAALQLVTPYIAARPKAGALPLLLLSSISCWSLVHANRFSDARDLVQERLYAVPPERPLRPSPILDSVVGVSYLMQGDLPQAKRSLLRVMEDTNRSSAMTAEVQRHLAGYLAEVHYQLGELDLAEPLVDECAGAVELVGPLDSVLSAYRAQAQLLHAKGQSDLAVEVLDRLEASARVRGIDRVVATCLAEKVHLELAQGQRTAAEESIRRLRQLASRYEGRGKGTFADIPYYLGVAEAEVAAASGEHARALETLVDLIALCEAQGRLFRATTLRVRAAVSWAAEGKEAMAFDVLAPAVAFAARYSMRRVFLHEGEPALKLLSEWLHRRDPTQAEQDYARSVIDTGAAVEPGPARLVSASTRTDALSVRELEILALLAKAFSTKGIARTLDLSAQTVKWHLKNIYIKLGAGSREDAVVKARNINLVT